jgi:hypothetical protein
MARYDKQACQPGGGSHANLSSTRKRARSLWLFGDKVIYALTQALRRVARPTFYSLLEPRYKQDLSANPKRAAKALKL